MNCRQALEYFHDHVEGQLGLVERWRLRLHLWICAACRRYLRSYRATVRAEKAAFAASESSGHSGVPDDVVRSIIAATGVRLSNQGESGSGEPRS